MAGLPNQFIPLGLSTFNTTGLSTSYQLVGAVFEFPVQLIRILNGSDRIVTISFDGTNDADVVLPSGTFGNQLEIQAGAAAVTSTQAAFKAGSGIYVKSTGSGTGLIYVAAYTQIHT